LSRKHTRGTNECTCSLSTSTTPPYPSIIDHPGHPSSQHCKLLTTQQPPHPPKSFGFVRTSTSTKRIKQHTLGRPQHPSPCHSHLRRDLPTRHRRLKTPYITKLPFEARERPEEIHISRTRPVHNHVKRQSLMLCFSAAAKNRRTHSGEAATLNASKAIGWSDPATRV